MGFGRKRGSAVKLALTVVSPFLFRGLPGKLLGLDASALGGLRVTLRLPAT